MTIANFFLHPLTPSSCQSLSECSCISPAALLAVIFLHLRVAVGTFSSSRDFFLVLSFFLSSIQIPSVCIPNDCLQQDTLLI